jgi:protoheme IX farnesyltransferase
MLPVVSGKPETRRQIVIYTVLVVGCAFAPVILGFAGPLYLAANGGIGLWFLVQSLRVAAERDTDREPQARKLFGVSILYLFALFAALLVEAGVEIAPIAPLVAG